MKKFAHSEAGQRKVTQDKDDNYPPHRADSLDEVRAVLGVVHAFNFGARERRLLF